MRRVLLVLSTVICFASCTNKSQNDFKVTEGSGVKVLKLSDKISKPSLDSIVFNGKLDTSGLKFMSDQVSTHLMDVMSIQSFNKDKRPKVTPPNTQLPPSFTGRTFFDGIADNDNLSSWVGHFVKYDQKAKKFVPLVIQNLFKDPTKQPEIKSGNHQVYKSIVNGGSAFNGSFLIATVVLTVDSRVELNVNDVTSIKGDVNNVNPDAVEFLKNYVKSINEDASNYYYVSDMVETDIAYRNYLSTKVKASLTYTISVNDETYYSKDDLTNDTKISADLITLPDFVPEQSKTTAENKK